MITVNQSFKIAANRWLKENFQHLTGKMNLWHSFLILYYKLII